MTGQELKDLRKKHSLTQKELAELLKLKTDTIKRYESDSRKIADSQENYINIILREIQLPNL